jgi:hypothetical protein
MRKKHDITPKCPNVQASASTMNKHPYSGCHYKRDSGSIPAGMNNLHTRGPAGQQTPGGSSATAPPAATTTSASGGQTAAAMTSGQRCCEKALAHVPTRGARTSHQSQRARGPTAGGADGLVGGETSSGDHHLSTNDSAYLRASATLTNGGRPACTGRSPLKSSQTGRHRPLCGGVVPE